MTGPSGIGPVGLPFLAPGDRPPCTVELDVFNVAADASVSAAVPPVLIREAVASARAWCASCSVIVECAAWAESNWTAASHGVWGGTTPAERRAHRPPPETRVLVPCGSYGAYKRHIARGEHVCGPCRDAHRVYQHARRSPQLVEGANP